MSPTDTRSPLVGVAFSFRKQNRGQGGKTFEVLDEQLKPLAEVLSEASRASSARSPGSPLCSELGQCNKPVVNRSLPSCRLPARVAVSALFLGHYLLEESFGLPLGCKFPFTPSWHTALFCVCVIF